MKYKILLDGILGYSDDSEADFLFETWEETVDKAKFFLDQGYSISIQNIEDEERG